MSLALFYGTSYGVLGTHLPFFTVWLKAIGIESGWIGIISAVPAVTRFTTLPFVTSLAERRRALRGAMILTAFATALCFVLLGTQQQPLPVLVLYIVTCCCWTPLTPLTDAYALRGVTRYKFDYGPVRLWGSVAFILGALACGLLIDVIAARQLIWVIVAMATISALTGLSLQPLEDVPRTPRMTEGGKPLLRDVGFLAIMISSALIQSSHVAYYTFASINWQNHGLGGLTIAGLWTLGVCAEIIVFAVSPRFSLHPTVLVLIGGISAAMRWSITAHEPPIAVLAIAQLGHGLSFGLTQVGVMNLMVRHVPPRQMARGQGYYAATGGLLSAATSIISGAIYARYGEGLYYMMAVMAAAGAVVIWSARHRLIAQPQSDTSGG